MAETKKTTIKKNPTQTKQKRVPNRKKKVANYDMNGRIEYVNHSKSVIVHVDRLSYYNDAIEAVMLRPGESVFFTDHDLARNKLQSPKFFTDGLLRCVEANEDRIEQIEVRDDMSIPEIEAFVERAEIIDPFERDLSKLSSLNTLDEVEEHCKRLNKTWSYIEAVGTRKIEIKEERKVR